MTPDIKALIKRLHEKTWESDRGEDDDPHTAADALEALAGEVERLQLLDTLKGNFSSALLLAEQHAERAEAERDRLKDEVERLRIEKVAGGAGSQIIGRGADQFIVDDPFGPPTDPAPAVCEWTKDGGRTVSTCMPGGITQWVWNGNRGRSDKDIVNALLDLENCPNCWNKRKFTEAKE